MEEKRGKNSTSGSFYAKIPTPKDKIGDLNFRSTYIKTRTRLTVKSIIDLQKRNAAGKRYMISRGRFIVLMSKR